jgi:hypothetical protein
MELLEKREEEHLRYPQLNNEENLGSYKARCVAVHNDL